MMISAVCLTVHARMYMLFLNENYNNSFMEGWQYIARHQNHTSDICYCFVTIGITIDCTDVHASMYITEEVT